MKMRTVDYQLIWIIVLTTQSVFTTNAKKVENCFNVDQGSLSQDTVQLACSEGVISDPDIIAGLAETDGCRINITTDELCPNRLNEYLGFCNGKVTCDRVILKELLDCPDYIRLAYRITFNCIENLTSNISTQSSTTTINATYFPFTMLKTTFIPTTTPTTSISSNEDRVQTTTTTRATTNFSITTSDSGTITPIKTSAMPHEMSDDETLTLVIVLSIVSGVLAAITAITVFCLCRLKQKARKRHQNTKSERHISELRFSAIDNSYGRAINATLSPPSNHESPEKLYCEIREDMFDDITKQEDGDVAEKRVNILENVNGQGGDYDKVYLKSTRGNLIPTVSNGRNFASDKVLSDTLMDLEEATHGRSQSNSENYQEGTDDSNKLNELVDERTSTYIEKRQSIDQTDETYHQIQATFDNDPTGDYNVLSRGYVYAENEAASLKGKADYNTISDVQQTDVSTENINDDYFVLEPKTEHGHNEEDANEHGETNSPNWFKTSFLLEAGAHLDNPRTRRSDGDYFVLDPNYT